jgi:hypothetical protein
VTRFVREAYIIVLHNKPSKSVEAIRGYTTIAPASSPRLATSERNDLDCPLVPEYPLSLRVCGRPGGDVYQLR